MEPASRRLSARFAKVSSQTVRLSFALENWRHPVLTRWAWGRVGRSSKSTARPSSCTREWIQAYLRWATSIRAPVRASSFSPTAPTVRASSSLFSSCSTPIPTSLPSWPHRYNRRDRQKGYRDSTMNQRASQRERHVSFRLLFLFLCMAATVAAVGQQPDAPVQARVLMPPAPTKGSDGKMHVAYEVHVTSSYGGNEPLRLTKL